MNLSLPVKPLHSAAQLPSYGSPGAAALDLRACLAAPRLVPPGGRSVIPTGLAMAVPEGHVLLLFSRSGHGLRQGLRLANCVGVIDPDYRGEVGVVIANDSNQAQVIEPGERIAQCLLVQSPRCIIQEVSELSDTERGAGGFGSTGTH